MRKNIIGALVAIMAMLGILLVAPSASAVPQAKSDKATTFRAGAEDFALVCDLNSSYRARVDMDDVYITQVGGKVDVYDSDSGWKTWTAKGGTTTDGTTVAPSVHWDPAAKWTAKGTWTAIRMKAWYGNGGSSGSCTSPARTT
jgi:hypothetical protein